MGFQGIRLISQIAQIYTQLIPGIEKSFNSLFLLQLIDVDSVNDLNDLEFIGMYNMVHTDGHLLHLSLVICFLICRFCFVFFFFIYEVK